MSLKVFCFSALLFLGFTLNICSAQLLNFTTDMARIRDLNYKLNGKSIEFPDDYLCEIHKEEGNYVPKNIIATRMQIYGYEAIIAQPRYKRGVPATLVSTSLKTDKCYLKTKAFPNWKTQQEGNCNAIQSAVDLYLDKNDKLWVLDAGTVDLMDRPSTKCPPKVVCIDMASRKVVKKIELSDFCAHKTGVQFIVVENGPNGNDHIYISDAPGKALIVINSKTGDGKRLSLQGATSNCSDDSALYMALLMKGDFKNYLYITYASCPEIISIETSQIHLIKESANNNCYCICDYDDKEGNDDKKEKKIHCMKVIATKPKNFNIIFSGTDSLSRLYFRRTNKNEVYTWDANTPMVLESCSLVQKGSPDRLITHVTPGPWKLLWYIESNFNDFVVSKTGCMGASTIIQPIAREVDRKLLTLESLLKL